MRRLCSDSSRSYPGRSALHALNLFCNNSRLGPYRETKVLASPAVADGDETRTTGIRGEKPPATRLADVFGLKPCVLGRFKLSSVRGDK